MGFWLGTLVRSLLLLMPMRPRGSSDPRASCRQIFFLIQVVATAGVNIFSQKGNKG